MSYTALGLEMGGQVSGQYTDNALTKKIIANDGATDDESMKEYGQVAGSMGGAAACAAFVVTAPLIPVCAVLGGWIGGLVATLIPLAKGPVLAALWPPKESGHADFFRSLIWGIRNSQYSRNYGMLAVKAYLTLRAEVVKEMVARGWTVQEATNELHAAGLLGGAVLARWKPIADQWRYWEALNNKLNWPEPVYVCAEVQKNVKPYISCLDLQRIYVFRGHIPAPPSEPIDFSLVARDEWAVRNAENHKLKDIPPLHLSVPSWSVAGYKYSTQRPWPGRQRPSDIAKAKIEKLKQIRAALPAQQAARAALKAAADARVAKLRKTTVSLKTEYSEEERRAAMKKYAAIALVVGAGALATYMVVKRRG